MIHFPLRGFSDVLSIHRYCRDRFVDFVPAVDVDVSTTAADLQAIQAALHEVVACFDNSK